MDWLRRIYLGARFAVDSEMIRSSGRPVHLMLPGFLPAVLVGTFAGDAGILALSLIWLAGWTGFIIWRWAKYLQACSETDRQNRSEDS